jgi:hypothetical protein
MIYFVTLHRKSSQTMEKNNENTLQKIRSGRACISDGYQWFSARFRRIFRLTWPAALVFAVISAVASALPVLVSPAFVWPAIGLWIVAVILFLAYTSRRLRKHLLEPTGPIPFSARMRHLGLTVLVTIVCLIAVIVLTLITSLPMVIMMAANWESQIGVLMGDPAGMPDYVKWLSIGAFLIAGFLQAYVWMTIIAPLYMANITIALREKERKELNIEKI